MSHLEFRQISRLILDRKFRIRRQNSALGNFLPENFPFSIKVSIFFFKKQLKYFEWRFLSLKRGADLCRLIIEIDRKKTELCEKSAIQIYANGPLVYFLLFVALETSHTQLNICCFLCQNYESTRL